MKNFKLGAIICLFAAVMMMAVGCGSTKQAADKAPLVKTAQAGTGTVASDNTYSGTVRGRYETNMSFQVGGQILSRNVQAGSQCVFGTRGCSGCGRGDDSAAVGNLSDRR